MANNGWIKLHRKLSESSMYQSLNSKQRDVMIQCLLLANHSESQWEWGGEIYSCRPGEFVTSLENIAKRCGKDVKVQSVRTAISKLVKWQFLTNKSTKTGRLIKIVKWRDYQDEDEQTNKVTNKQLTKSQQRANKELTTNKNDKNEKNDKNDKNIGVVEKISEKEQLVINRYLEHFPSHYLKPSKMEDLIQLEREHGMEYYEKALEVAKKAGTNNVSYLRTVLNNQKATGYLWGEKKQENKRGGVFSLKDIS